MALYYEAPGRGPDLNKKNYDARFPLGEHIPNLKGVAIEMDSANPSSIRIDVWGELADPVVVDQLMNEMATSGQFHRGSTEQPNEFVFIPKGNSEGKRDSAQNAISRIMESPRMQEVVAMRKLAMEAADAKREEERLAADEARSTLWREEQGARDAAHKGAEELAQ